MSLYVVALAVDGAYSYGRVIQYRGYTGVHAHSN